MTVQNKVTQINRSFSLYPRQFAIIEMHALKFDGNLSFALRRIIDEWEQGRTACVDLPLTAQEATR
jgi:hypothetical protein